MEGRPEGPRYRSYYALSGLERFASITKGRRAPLRFTLAPGFICRALGAGDDDFEAKPSAVGGILVALKVHARLKKAIAALAVKPTVYAEQKRDHNDENLFDLFARKCALCC